MGLLQEMEFEDGTQVELISETKLAGLILIDKLSWHMHTKYVTQKDKSELQIIRRKANLYLSPNQMYDAIVNRLDQFWKMGYLYGTQD